MAPHCRDLAGRRFSSIPGCAGIRRQPSRQHALVRANRNGNGVPKPSADEHVDRSDQRWQPSRSLGANQPLRLASGAGHLSSSGPFPQQPSLRDSPPASSSGTPWSPGPSSVLSTGSTSGCYNPPFTLNQLQVFKVLAIADSLEHAEKLLQCRDSNLRAALKSLERSLGGVEVVAKPLYKDRPAALTPSGRLLLKYTDRILAIAADLQAALADLNNANRGVLFVGASQTTGVYVMPHIIESFKRRRPNLAINLCVENTARCCRAVAGGDLELALVGGDVPEDLVDVLQVTTYTDDEVVLVAAPTHELALRGGPLPIADLRALRFVSLYRSSTVQGIAARLEASGIDWQSLEVVMEVNSVEAIKSAVAVDLGVAFVSRKAVVSELRAGTLAELPVEGLKLTRQLQVVTDPRRYYSRAMRAFIREMFELVGSADAAEKLLGARSTSPPFRGPGAGGGGSLSMPPMPPPPSASPSYWQEPWRPRLEPLACPGGPRAIPSQPAKLPFTLGQLAAFHAVAATGSTKAASQALAVSQPNVSKQLSGLEVALSTALVRWRGQSGPRLQLREAGALLLGYAEAMMQAVGEAARALEDLRSARTGVVTLAASHTTGTYVLPRLLGMFRQRNPQVMVQVQLDCSDKACGEVAAGRADMALVGGEVPPELRTALKVMPYGHDELVLVCGRDHPLASRPPAPSSPLSSCGCISDQELYALPFVALSPGNSLQATQEQLLRQAGITPRRFNVDLEFNSVEAIKGAVQYGVGVAFVPSTAISKELELGLLRRVPIRGIKLLRPLQLVTQAGRQFSPAAERFLEDVFAWQRQPDGSMEEPQQPAPPMAAFARRPWEPSHVPDAAAAAATAAAAPAATAAAAPLNVNGGGSLAMAAGVDVAASDGPLGSGNGSGGSGGSDAMAADVVSSKPAK